MLDKIENVYLIGLGAMGCLYASKIYDYNPAIIRIVVDENRKIRYENDGVSVNNIDYHFDYVTPSIAGQLPKADLIIVGVKINQLENAIKAIIPFVKPQTRVLSILNGISSEIIIGENVGMDHMLYGYGVGMDAERMGTSVNYTQTGWLVFGEKNNIPLNSDVVLLQEFFQKTNIPFRTPDNMELALWKKFMLNVAANQVSAALKINYGVIKTSQYARNIMLDAAREVLSLSETLNIGLTEGDWENILSPMDNLDDKKYTSMCQDILAKRKTEVAMFGETVIALGKKYSIPTPVNKTLVEIIHFHESTY